MDGADDGPLGAHALDAAQQELTEAASLFDLPEHRLGQLLAQPIGAGVAAGSDLGVHGLDARWYVGRRRQEAPAGFCGASPTRVTLARRGTYAVVEGGVGGVSAFGATNEGGVA